MSKYDYGSELPEKGNSIRWAFDTIPEGSKVLELGCAAGLLTKNLKEQKNCIIDIVEFDKDTGEKAAQYANRVLIGNEQGDLENPFWSEVLSTEKYDVITFMDVLEHLKDPEDVLKKAVELLVEDGVIIISIPNIGHNSVIIDLINDKFEYSKLGILDETHLKFFTQESLEDLISNCGLVGVTKDYSVAAVGNTFIQNTYDDVDEAVATALKLKENSEVFQYLYVVKKKTEKITEGSFDYKPLISTIYIDLGEGFNEENTIHESYKLDNNRAKIQFDISQFEYIKSIRWDPVDIVGLVLSSVEVYIVKGENKLYLDTRINQDLLKTEHGDISYSHDPSYILCGEVLEGEILAIEFSFKPLSIVDTKRIADSRLLLHKELEEEKEKLEETKGHLEKTKEHLEKTKEHLEKNKQHLKEKLEELVIQIAALKESEGQLQNAKNQIDRVENILKTKLEELEAVNVNLNNTREELENTQNNLDIKLSEITNLQKQIESVGLELLTTKGELQHSHYDNNQLQLRMDVLEQKNEELSRVYAHVMGEYNGILNSTCWKLTKPYRLIISHVTKIVAKNWILAKIVKVFRSIRIHGVKNTIKRIIYTRKYKRHIQKYGESARSISMEDKNAQTKFKFTKDIKFSVVVPLYNTPINFLEEMIESVQNQTYENWELCLADGSDNEHAEVEKRCKDYIKNDKRIKYKKLQENLGISENTNKCIEMATGDYIALFDHDDLLHPAALYFYMHEICNHNADFVYCDELTFLEELSNVTVVHHKPDFAIDNLRANNYICHFSVFKKSLIDKVGGFRKEFDGSQDYDLILRLTEEAEVIRHVPEVLYFWRAHKNSVALNIDAKPYALEAAKNAIRKHLERSNIKATVSDTRATSCYRIEYEILEEPLISILIPNKDSLLILKQCIQSVLEKTTYENYEIVIVENNSETEEIMEYYKELESNAKIKIVTWAEEFNYSKINNYGFKYCNGEYIILLNNDIEVIEPKWIEEMLMLNQREEVGAVGAKLYYPNDSIQHAGVILGMGGVAAHAFRTCGGKELGYMGRLIYTQNVTAVTAACLMIKKSVFEEVNGLDEGYAVAFNDVDLCMKVRSKGHLICWTPWAELYHHESISRGHEDTPEKQERFMGEIKRFQTKWSKELAAGDPYYNKNLTLNKEDFSLR